MAYLYKNILPFPTLINCHTRSSLDTGTLPPLETQSLRKRRALSLCPSLTLRKEYQRGPPSVKAPLRLELERDLAKMLVF